MKITEFLNSLKKMTKEELLEIKGIGENIADELELFVNSNRYQKLQQKFLVLEEKKMSPTLVINNLVKDNLILNNEYICITGTFEISRNKIQKKLEELGAIVQNQITNKTTILLAGENPGSKVEKAKKKKIKIINNLNFLEKIS